MLREQPFDRDAKFLGGLQGGRIKFSRGKRLSISRQVNFSINVPRWLELHCIVVPPRDCINIAECRAFAIQPGRGSGGAQKCNLYLRSSLECILVASSFEQHSTFHGFKLFIVAEASSTRGDKHITIATVAHDVITL